MLCKRKERPHDGFHFKGEIFPPSLLFLLQIPSFSPAFLPFFRFMFQYYDCFLNVTVRHGTSTEGLVF